MKGANSLLTNIKDVSSKMVQSVAGLVFLHIILPFCAKSNKNKLHLQSVVPSSSLSSPDSCCSVLDQGSNEWGLGNILP